MRQPFDDVTGDGQRVRAAAIAAMGQRLAAAGPRTRRRVTQRSHPVVEQGEEHGEPALPEPARAPALVADRSQAFLRDIAPILPPRPRRRAMSVIGRTVALAAMASAGFAVVLLAQSPRWSAARRPAAQKLALAAAPAKGVIPAKAIPAAPQAQTADAAADTQPARPPASAAPPAASAAPPPAIEKPVAMPPQALPPAPMLQPPPAPIRPSRSMQVQLAATHRPKLPVQIPFRVALRQEAARPIAKHPVMNAKYVLPRWLTDAHDAPPRQVIMSPPPRDLEAPAQAALQVASPAPAVRAAASAPPEKPRSLLPPLPRPRLIFATAGYMPQAPYRGPYGGYYGPASPPAPYWDDQRQPTAP
jgi:hypothetical protein